MWILASFTDGGVPASGISPLPTIRIRDVATSSVVVSDISMSETGDGFYAYDFAAQDFEKDYTFRCDAGDYLTDSERYTFGSSGPYDESIDDIQTVVNSTETTITEVDVRTELLRKFQTNRLELIDGDTYNWVLYDDDDTALLYFSVSDRDGKFIIQTPHTPSRRNKAVFA